MNHLMAGVSPQSVMGESSGIRLPIINLIDTEGKTKSLSTGERIIFESRSHSGRIIEKVNEGPLLVLIERAYVGMACDQLKLDLNSQDYESVKRLMVDYRIAISDATHQLLFVDPGKKGCIKISDEDFQTYLRLEQAPITTSSFDDDLEALRNGYWQGFEDGYLAASSGFKKDSESACSSAQDSSIRSTKTKDSAVLEHTKPENMESTQLREPACKGFTSHIESKSDVQANREDEGIDGALWC